jgi:hypothetical protein
MKIYVRAKSKREINERLAAGENVWGTNHSAFGDGGPYQLGPELPNGTVIATYTAMVGGSPIAKYYGTWDGAKVT